MLLTFVIGFAILGYLALRVHSDCAPVPGRVVDETGQLLMTREEILQGQEAFLTHGPHRRHRPTAFVRGKRQSADPTLCSIRRGRLPPQQRRGFHDAVACSIGCTWTTCHRYPLLKRGLSVPAPMTLT
jgi:nitric oxide reductase subunit B